MRIFLQIVILFLFIGTSVAQEVKFSVGVSADTLLVGNYLELKYTVENAQPNGFEPPSFTGLEIVGGPNT